VNWASHLVPLDERRKDSLNSMVSGGIRALEEGGFLGYEFLTWLWFFIEQPHELLCLPQDRKAEIHLGERMILSLPQGGKERIVCTTQANALHEARTALRQGKQVEQIQLFLRAGDNEYLFTLDSTGSKAEKNPTKEWRVRRGRTCPFEHAFTGMCPPGVGRGPVFRGESESMGSAECRLCGKMPGPFHPRLRVLPLEPRFRITAVADEGFVRPHGGGTRHRGCRSLPVPGAGFIPRFLHRGGDRKNRPRQDTGS